MGDSSAWMTQQLLDLAERPAHRSARFNPHPPGIFRAGSASDAVLAFLVAHPGRFFRRESIIVRTNRTAKAVDAALLFLRANGLVESIPDTIRNSRYLRYRAVIKVESCPPRTITG
jgi:hypothetical protein